MSTPRRQKDVKGRWTTANKEGAPQSDFFARPAPRRLVFTPNKEPQLTNLFFKPIKEEPVDPDTQANTVRSAAKAGAGLTGFLHLATKVFIWLVALLLIRNIFRGDGILLLRTIGICLVDGAVPCDKRLNLAFFPLTEVAKQRHMDFTIHNEANPEVVPTPFLSIPLAFDNTLVLIGLGLTSLLKLWTLTYFHGLMISTVNTANLVAPEEDHQKAS